jgi:hypothetical protein
LFAEILHVRIVCTWTATATAAAHAQFSRQKRSRACTLTMAKSEASFASVDFTSGFPGPHIDVVDAFSELKGVAHSHVASSPQRQTPAPRDDHQRRAASVSSMRNENMVTRFLVRETKSAPEMKNCKRNMCTRQDKTRTSSLSASNASHAPRAHSA